MRIAHLNSSLLPLLFTRPSNTCATGMIRMQSHPWCTACCAASVHNSKCPPTPQFIPHCVLRVDYAVVVLIELLRPLNPLSWKGSTYLSVGRCAVRLHFFPGSLVRSASLSCGTWGLPSCVSHERMTAVSAESALLSNLRLLKCVSASNRVAVQVSVECGELLCICR
jgi:hypothetical protein